MRTRRPPPARLGEARGQSLVEFALLLPLLLTIALGVVEIGYLLLDQQVVVRLSREGSNLISRNTTLEDAVAALQTMSSRPVDFSTRSKVIFSVLKKGATTGTGNYDQIFLYQRREFGSLSDGSRLVTRGGGVFGGAPDYQAANADNATGLQVTNVPSNLIAPRGGMIYVTEIYTAHETLTPLAQFGISTPPTLYSIAYF
ncbi:MAG: pilus assembly protein [Acidobacteria bacterium]|nr:pilus assembly protein [Acidobacteriota bacterium]